MDDLTTWLKPSTDRTVELVGKYIDGASWSAIAKSIGYSRPRLKYNMADFIVPQHEVEKFKREYASRQLKKFKRKSLK